MCFLFKQHRFLKPETSDASDRIVTINNTLQLDSVSLTRDADGLICPNTSTKPNFKPSRRHVDKNKNETNMTEHIVLPACITDRSAMLRLQHKRRHYTAERLHYGRHPAGQLGHGDVLKVSSFKQCVGFGARPQHRLLFEKNQ